MPDTAVGIIVILASLLLSITLHEAMHAMVAHWLGDDTAKMMGRATLNPLKHIDPFTTVALPVILFLMGIPPFAAAKPVPMNPRRLRGQEFGAAAVAVAGPLTNLALAFLGGALLRLDSIATASVLGQSIFLFTILNVGLFVFNMIPFPPLDGSRLLYAFAPGPLQRIFEQIEAFGFTAIVLFMFLILPLIQPLMATLIHTITGVVL
jgi:Zn-dependent protease